MTPSDSIVGREGRLRTVACFLLLLIVSLAAYWPALSGAFLWDDPAHITFAHLRSLDGLVRIWTEPGATQQYYPLLHSAFWLEHRLWGDAPLGYHLVNVVQHAVCAGVLVLFLRRLWPDRSADWLGAPELAGLIFALHPVAVESVAWISEQKNTLSLLFYLAAALAYLRYDDERRAGLYRWALLCYALALLTKSVTATLPAALLVVIWYRRGRLRWREDVVPLLPWFGLGVSFGLFTAWMEHSVIGAQGEEYYLSPLQRILLAGRVLWFYVANTVWPTGLMFIYPRWDVPVEAAWWWPCLAGAVLVTAGLWRVRERTRGPLAAWLLFAGTLFPALGFVNVFPFRFSYVADHFQYLALLAPVTLAASGLAWVGPRLPPPVRWFGGVAVLGTLAVLVSAQSRHYLDKETLWRANWERNPDSWIVCNDLGQVLLDSGRAKESLFYFRQALGVAPRDVSARVNLAVAFEAAGYPREAMAQYVEALRRNPGQPVVLVNLGDAFSRLGRFSEAVQCYAEAMRLGGDPEGGIRYNLGLALLNGGETARALSCFEEVTQLRPASAPAWNMQGVALFELGRTPEAVERYRQAIRLEPGNFEALNNLGTALLKLNQLPEAVLMLERATAAKPDWPVGLKNLAIALVRSGRPTEAVAKFQAARAADPADADTHYKLGVILAQTGQAAEAVQSLREALRVAPSFAAAHIMLADLLAVAGRPEEAAQHRAAASRLQNPPDGAR